MYYNSNLLNKDTINSNLYSFSKKTTNNKLEQLLELFNLDKDLFSDENIIFELNLYSF